MKRFRALTPQVQAAIKRTALVIAVLAIYRIGLPLLDSASLLTQVLAPNGSQLVALIAIGVTVVARMFLILVAPVLLVLGWAKAAWPASNLIRWSRIKLGQPLMREQTLRPSRTDPALSHHTVAGKIRQVVFRQTTVGDQGRPHLSPRAPDTRLRDVGDGP
jgi:hypothetical protein